MKSLTIIKVGGKVVEEPESLSKFLNDFTTIQGHKLLVHGGGRSATRLSEKLGIQTQMMDGRRITDAATLEVVTMVYAGWVNKSIVAALQAKGCNALGLSGADLNLILAKKREDTPIDYGFVGDVISVQTNEISSLIEKGVIPVVAPITHDGKGQLLNTNADTIASSLAAALAGLFEVTLIYCFEKKGVLLNPDDDSTVISVLSHAKFKELQDSGSISEGMIPKLDNGFDALSAGVKKVVITNTNGLKNEIFTGTILIQ